MYIKGFDKNLRCRGYQFEIGKEYEIKNNGGELRLCSDTVFHFCDSLRDVHEFYSVTENNRYCEIEPLGEVIYDDNRKKYGSNKIRIVREIVGEELNILKGTVNGNTGVFNTGDFNTGSWNAGDFNTGSRNTGDYNTGYHNTGYCNTGDNNKGDRNVGDCNIGDCNTGSNNKGDQNTGDRNVGDFNTGNRNMGCYNTGHYNIGFCNTGNYNKGRRNTGDRNVGGYNVGNWNAGDWNTGNWNAGDYNTGWFCKQDGKMFLFDKETDMSRSEVAELLNPMLDMIDYHIVKWICKEDMSQEEKEQNPSYKTTDGYLKVLSMEECNQIWWDGLSEKEKNVFYNLPNFDKETFEECMGIIID